MRRLLTLGLVLVALALLYVVVDLVAKGVVEGRVADEFEAEPRLEVDSASFAIDSFPFLARLAAFGEVSATLELEGVRQQGVTLDRFTLEVDGLVLDRGSAFGGEVRADDLDRAVASVELGEGTISDLVGVPVAIGGGTVSVDGTTVGTSMAGSELVLTGEGVGSLTVPLELGRFLPCDPTAEVLDGLVRLSCETGDLPPIVNRVLGRVT